MRWFLATVLGLLLACGIPAAVAQSWVAEGATQHCREHLAATLEAGKPALTDNACGNVHDQASASGNILVSGTAVTGVTVQAPSFPGEGASNGRLRPGRKLRPAMHTGSTNLAVSDGLRPLLRMAVVARSTSDDFPCATCDGGDEPEKWAKTRIRTPAAAALLECRRGEIRAMRPAAFLEVRERPPQ